MKARKTLQHQQLVSEVMTQLQSFKPTPPNIKRKIEVLHSKLSLKASLFLWNSIDSLKTSFGASESVHVESSPE